MTPETAALSALVDHLMAQLPGLRVLRGWPQKRLDLSTGPALSVSLVGDPRWLPCAAESCGETRTGDDVTVLYRVAQARVSIQLTVWAAYRPQRDEAAQSVMDALDPDVPATSGLDLRTAYHDQRVRFTQRSGELADGADGPGAGEWRADWLLMADVSRIRAVTHPAQIYGVDVALEME